MTIAKSLQYFINLSAIDVIKQILCKIGYKDNQIKFYCRNKYATQPYIVQIPNETDYEFLQRLLSDAGIFIG